LNSNESNTLESVMSAITLMLQGSFSDAHDLVCSIELPENTQVAALVPGMLELIDRLIGELSSKESALALLQTAMWELEEAKENLRTKEARYRTTLESIGDSLIKTDLQGHVQIMNAVAEQFTGWCAKDAVGRPISEILHIIDARTRSQAENPIHSAIREGASVAPASDVLVVARDGTERHITNSCAPIRDVERQILGAVLVSRDVTEDFHRREELRESEERFRVLFENSRDAIMTLAPPSWRFTSCNSAAIAMFGASSAAELTSLGPWDVSSALQPGGQRSDELAKQAIAKALRDGVNFFPWTHKRIDGSDFSATILLSRIELGGSTILQATIRDVTAQQRLEVELGHARKLEAVGQLAAGIAHEINTPAQFVGDSISFLADGFKEMQQLIDKYRQTINVLAAIPGHERLIEQLKEAEDTVDLPYLEENAPAAFTRSLDGIARISTIVSAMKNFAHPDQREKSPADLNQAIQATLTIARNEYKYVADVETEFGELPPVICHIGDMNQVLLNLIVNAAHAIFDVVATSGNRGRIRVRTMQEDDHVRVEIADTGCGIPEDVRERVFEPFFTTKEVGRGSGQGLAIARSIVVDKHGGSLTFDTEMGQGTTFTIRLPLNGKMAGLAAGTPSEEVRA